MQMPGRHTAVLVLALVLVLGYSNISIGKTIWVSTTGDDGNGSDTANGCPPAQNKTTAVQTVRAGLACLVGGDTLMVTSGTYAEGIRSKNTVTGVNSIPNGSPGAPTIIKSEVQYGATLRPVAGSDLSDFNNLIIRLIDEVGPVHDIVLDGFTLDMNGYGSRCGGQGVQVSGGSTYNIEVKNMDISHTATNNAGCQANASNSVGILTGMYGGQPQAVWVHHNRIHDLEYEDGAWSLTFEDGAMGWYNIGQNALFENNTIWRIAGYCSESWRNTADPQPSGNIIRNNVCHTTGGIGWLVGSGNNNQFYNNVIYDSGHNPNTSHAGFVISTVGCCSIDNNQIYNNTIVQNPGTSGALAQCISVRVPGNQMTNTFIRNNICYQNGDNVITSCGPPNTCFVDHNLVGPDPQFVDLAGHDYHLTSGSPARGAGVSVGLATDAGGNNWLNPPSEGAFEFTTSVAPPSPQLLAWWKFDETTGATAVDEVGNTHPATLDTGFTHASPKVGVQSLGCDGTHTATVTGVLPSTGNYTYMFWISGNNAPTNSFGNQIVLQNGTGSDSFGFAWASAPGHEHGAYQQDAAGSYVTAQIPGTFLAGTWYHIAARFDGGHLTAFLNGVPQTPAPAIASMQTASGNFLWCNSGFGTNGFPGSIDQGKVWNYALTDAQIAAEYRSSAAVPRHRALAQ